MATLNQDGQKRAGRFIKNGHRLLDHVSIGNYSFEEICPTPIASFDNEDSSIIHARLHTDTDLKATVREHPKFDQTLKHPEGERFVIKPVDFTPEWNSSVSPSTGRRRKIGRTDDAMELSDEGQRELAAIFGDAPPPGARPGTNAPGPEASGSAEDATREAQQMSASPGPGPGMTDSNENDTGASPLEREAGSFRINRQEGAPASESFIPLATNPVTTATTVEAAAADAWKVRKEIEQEMAKAIADAKEAATQEGLKSGYDAGYQEGFRVGEEKGELGARQTASQFFGRAAELISEFESLKGQILENVQQNFFDLCQAMGEALLEREFEIHPDSFATIMRKAVSETVKGDQFKIRLNPETADAMAKAGIKDLDAHLVKDAQVAPWEFRLESQLSVVDVQAKKMIKNLLGQADVSLFSKTEKAS